MSRKIKPSAPFLQKYLMGELLADDIDDCIDLWHEGNGRKPLHAFLGMTKEEYSLWLSDPELLPHIALARRNKAPLRSVVDGALRELPIAARSADNLSVRPEMS